MENIKLTIARKHCKENNLRYMIKNNALYLYVPIYKRYVQTCYNLLNFNDESAIKKHIDEQIYLYRPYK